jgi:hypothetical protein
MTGYFNCAYETKRSLHYPWLRLRFGRNAWVFYNSTSSNRS